MIADFLEKLLQGILLNEYRKLVFNNLSQNPKDHQDLMRVLRNLQIKAFKVFNMNSGDRGNVTNRQ